MKISIARGHDPAECMAGLKGTSGDDPRLVLFFCSPALDVACASSICSKTFPHSETIGCSTAGEISSGSMSEHSIVAMAISREYVAQVRTAYIANPGDPAEVAKAVCGIEIGLGFPIRDLNPAHYVGVVIVDGLSRTEEKLMDKLGDLADIPFVGGSAGDDLAFRKTWVCRNGATSDHGAVIAVMHVPNGYRIVKAQSFRSTGKCLTATAVDEAARTVLAFNGRPAAEAYAAAVGVDPAKLSDVLMRHPLGLMIEGEPFVRSPQRVDGTDVVFYCNVREGSELEILESTDIVADTRESLAACINSDGPPAALIDFHCILRTLELRAAGTCEAYGHLFDGFPAIGFSTYGEEYVGHMNQTSTMLMLKG